MHRRSRTSATRGVLLAGVVAAVLLGAACEGPDDEVGLGEETPASPPTTLTPTPDPSPTPDDGGAAVFEGGTDPVTLERAPDQETAVLEEVRIARHDDFDRVVWEFAAGDRPQVWVEYTDQARQPGSGNPVDVAGTATLHVAAEAATDVGAELFAPGHEPYDGPSRVEGANTAVLTEAVALGDHEANMQWAVGVDATQPFRVDVLEDPLRLVLDVGH